MTDIEILMQYYSISKERAEIFKHYASSKVAISAYRAGYEKGASSYEEGFEEGYQAGYNSNLDSMYIASGKIYQGEE